MSRLAKNEGTRFDSGSRRWRRQPQTMSSSSASSFSTSAGISAGSFCRSPSEVTTTSPRERSNPAANAAVCPKLRRNRTALTRRSAASSSSSRARVPSVLPSSTSTSSKERPDASIAAATCRCRSDRFSASLYSGTTMETSGRSSPSIAPSISDAAAPPSAAGGQQVDPVHEKQHEHQNPQNEGETRAHLDAQCPTERQQRQVADPPDHEDPGGDRRQRVHGQRSGRVEGRQSSQGTSRPAGRTGQPGQALEHAGRERQLIEVEKGDDGAGQHRDSGEDGTERWPPLPEPQPHHHGMRLASPAAP